MLGAHLALALAVPGQTAELNPAALVYQLPDQIRWSSPSAAGAQNSVLVGDPSKPGLYVVLNKWLKGNHFSRPHFHPNDRFITVLGGTWWMGSGTNFDPDNSLPLPAGTFVTHFGKQVHWDGAKAEDASLLIFGEGPGTAASAQNAQFNESKRKELTAEDVRFTTKDGALYAFVMGRPEYQASIASLALNTDLRVGKIQSVELLGFDGKLQWSQDDSGLSILMPQQKTSDYAIVFKVTGAS